jgi:hypothetical protein
MQVYGLDKAQVGSAKNSQQDVHGGYQNSEIDGTCNRWTELFSTNLHSAERVIWNWNCISISAISQPPTTD